MAAILEAPHFPNTFHPRRMPPGTPPPNYKAFLLCISYLFCPGGSSVGNRPRPLAGPLNDAKEMKTVLIGGRLMTTLVSMALSPLSRSRS